MIRAISVVLLGLGMLLPAMASFACGRLDMQLQPRSILLNSNSFPQVKIRISRTKVTDPCSYFVTFGYGRGGSYMNRVLVNSTDVYPVQFWKDRSRSVILKDIGDAASVADVVSGTFSDSGEKSQLRYFYPEIEPETFKRYGVYSDTFSINLYEGTLQGVYALRKTLSLSLKYNQPRVTALSLVDSGAPFDLQDTSQVLDFGAMEAGKTLSCDLVVAYNAGYRISFRSSNNGRLKNSTVKNAYVDYTMRVNNVPIQWRTGGYTEIDTGVGVSPPTGLRYAIASTLGDVGAAPAGEYSDLVTIQIVSVE